ncbi:hypothetical protein AZE42_09955 [Rhizopogon vesiculosus]|uniref:Uncharacterized protein n=1 Tax=Rhizopogon vesiculosus TaxID=180088 RepID=A0A1J8RC26_9AGAM|nr:hypothetical protein AZE42_09955 [Rhizopogon vesiculosus]
MSLNVQVVK